MDPHMPVWLSSGRCGGSAQNDPLLDKFFEATQRSRASPRTTSILQYQRPNGEVIALLVIAPSKTNRERVIPMSAELFQVIAMIVLRQTAHGPSRSFRATTATNGSGSRRCPNAATPKGVGVRGHPALVGRPRVGSRPYGISCQHEHACLRCAHLHVNPKMLPRLDELGSDLADRRNRAAAKHG